MYRIRTLLRDKAPLEMTVGKHGEANTKEQKKKEKTERHGKKMVPRKRWRNGEPYRATNRFVTSMGHLSTHISMQEKRKKIAKVNLTSPKDDEGNRNFSLS